MIKQVLSGSAYLTAALSDSCFGAISGGGEKVELTFKQKCYTLTGVVLLLSPRVSSNVLSLSSCCPSYVQFKRTDTSDTRYNYNTQDSNLICGYLFNEQTVGENKISGESLGSDCET